MAGRCRLHYVPAVPPSLQLVVEILLRVVELLHQRVVDNNQ